MDELKYGSFIVLGILIMISLLCYAACAHLGWLTYVFNHSEPSMAAVDEIIKKSRPYRGSIDYVALASFEYHGERIQKKISFWFWSSFDIVPGFEVMVWISFGKHGKMRVLPWNGKGKWLLAFLAVGMGLLGLLMDVVFFMALSSVLSSYY